MVRRPSKTFLSEFSSGATKYYFVYFRHMHWIHQRLDCPIQSHNDFCMGRTPSPARLGRGWSISQVHRIERTIRHDVERHRAVWPVDIFNEICYITDSRWVECFQHLAKHKIPYAHLLTIVSYILCLPGTSAAVERVFSLINDVWSSEKSQLSIETLKCILLVRYNIKMTCLEFYDLLKSKPKLVEQIGSVDKYSFKQK